MWRCLSPFNYRDGAILEVRAHWLVYCFVHKIESQGEDQLISDQIFVSMNCTNNNHRTVVLFYIETNFVYLNDLQKIIQTGFVVFFSFRLVWKIFLFFFCYFLIVRISAHWVLLEICDENGFYLWFVLKILCGQDFVEWSSFLIIIRFGLDM